MKLYATDIKLKKKSYLSNGHPVNYEINSYQDVPGG